MQHGDETPDLPRSSQPPRMSVPPPPWRGWWRLLFASVWVGAQVALIITADRRPDGAFGFRMFSESSTNKIVLYREIAGEDGQRKRVHVSDGSWSARDAGGLMRTFSWTDRVRRRELALFDTEMSTKYATKAQLERLQAALDDVATHMPDDAETRRFLLDVTVSQNGREPYVVHLVSAERAGGGS